MIATTKIHKPRGMRHTNHTNGISNDVLQVDYGNGESGSRRRGLWQIGAIGCIFSVLVTVAVETKTDDLL